ncbi:MAG: DinB family protein [Thermoanaerobaculia bacterium]
MGLLAQTRQLLLYTLWADRLCLDAARGVPPEALAREAGVSFGSLLGTLCHILGSQRRWLARFTGQQATAGDPAFPDVESLAAGWSETASELEFFLASLTEEQLAAEIAWVDSEGPTYSRPLWQPVCHMVNHSTYHRGQVASLMRQLGYQPPRTDLIHFLLK